MSIKQVRRLIFTFSTTYFLLRWNYHFDFFRLNFNYLFYLSLYLTYIAVHPIISSPTSLRTRPRLLVTWLSLITVTTVTTAICPIRSVVTFYYKKKYPYNCFLYREFFFMFLNKLYPSFHLLNVRINCLHILFIFW